MMTVRALMIGLGVAGFALTPVVDALAQGKKAANCKTHYGRGWAPTESMAKFQAWEIIAQTTGNWPFMSDTFRNERYTCKPDGSMIRCESKIDVCKS
ncbi:MAG TPA: hypothetical protein VNK52_13960 [Hyphomicrobiaceae bacterium]|nr:hypothetical protein [Hyphomicrobiaceae bacterium]